MRFDNIFLTCKYEGKKVKKNINQWSEITGIKPETIHSRIKRQKPAQTNEMIVGLEPLAPSQRGPKPNTAKGPSRKPPVVAKRKKLFNLAAAFNRRALIPTNVRGDGA